MYQLRGQSHRENYYCKIYTVYYVYEILGIVTELTCCLTAESHWNSRELCTRQVEKQYHFSFRERLTTIRHYVDRIHKPHGWVVLNTFTNTHVNLDRSVRQWDVHTMRAYCTSKKFCSCLPVANKIQAQLYSLPKTLLIHKPDVGATYNRQICKMSQHTTPAVQQSLLRTTFEGYQCAQPRQLAAREQLRKCQFVSYQGC